MPDAAVRNSDMDNMLQEIRSALSRLETTMTNLSADLASLRTHMDYSKQSVIDLTGKCTSLDERVRAIEQSKSDKDRLYAVEMSKDALEKRIRAVEIKQYYMFIVGGAIGFMATLAASLLGNAIVKKLTD